jgi:hypothetical protein
VDEKVKVKKPNNEPGLNDGKIVRKDADGTYVVSYENGTVEEKVKFYRVVKAVQERFVIFFFFVLFFLLSVDF